MDPPPPAPPSPSPPAPPTPASAAPSLAALPSDLLRLILRRLPLHARLWSLSPVSKRFYTAAANGVEELERGGVDDVAVRRFTSLTRLVDPDPGVRCFPAGLREVTLVGMRVPLALFSLPRLESLTIDTTISIPPVAVELVEHAAQTLTHLGLSLDVLDSFNPAQNTQALRQLASLRLPSLISLSCVRFPAYHLTQLRPLFSQLTSLEILHSFPSASLFSGVATSRLRHFGGHWSTVQRLDRCPALTSLRVSDVPTTDLSAVLRPLQGLDLSLDLWVKTDDVELQLHGALAPLRSRLHSLTLHIDFVDFAAFRDVLSDLPALTRLAVLHSLEVLPVPTWPAPPKRLPNLRSLHLACASYALLETVLTECPSLTDLHLTEVRVLFPQLFGKFRSFVSFAQARSLHHFTVTRLVCPAESVPEAQQLWRAFTWTRVQIRSIVVQGSALKVST